MSSQQCCRERLAWKFGELHLHILCTGVYRTNGQDTAQVFAIRGANCIGYIVQPDETKKAAVWHVNDGTKVDGPSDENLFVFLWKTKPRPPHPE